MGNHSVGADLRDMLETAQTPFEKLTLRLLAEQQGLIAALQLQVKLLNPEESGRDDLSARARDICTNDF